MNGIFGVHRCEFHRSRRQKSQTLSIFIAKRVSFTCWFRPFPSPSYLNGVDIIRIRMSQCQPNRLVGENSSQLQRLQFFPISILVLFVCACISSPHFLFIHLFVIVTHRAAFCCCSCDDAKKTRKNLTSSSAHFHLRFSFSHFLSISCSHHDTNNMR